MRKIHPNGNSSTFQIEQQVSAQLKYSRCFWELMEKCHLLAQYSQYVGRVQKYASGMILEEAVKKAVEECIREGILADFLQKNRAEAIAVQTDEN